MWLLWFEADKKTKCCAAYPASGAQGGLHPFIMHSATVIWMTSAAADGGMMEELDSTSNSNDGTTIPLAGKMDKFPELAVQNSGHRHILLK